MRFSRVLLILLSVFAFLPAAHAASPTSDYYHSPDTVFVQNNTAATPGSGQLVCAGSSLPQGWAVLDYYQDGNVPCFVQAPYFPANVWSIQNLNNSPVGTVINICVDYNKGLPSMDWRVVRYFPSSSICGRPQNPNYFNAVQIQRVSGPLTASSANQGSFDAATCTSFRGWAWDSNVPGRAVNLDILSDGVLVAQIQANQFRGDLANAGIGNGFHSFNILPPPAVVDGLSHSISLRVTGTSTLIPGSPKVIQCANPIDDQSFFVRRHYLEFLGREADQAGLAYWTNNITQCGSNTACIQSQRIETSRAFLVSIEFQETGFFLHRFYKASYGRVPYILEFFPEKARISNGVVVGTPGWDQLLESNKRAFADSWVQRATFKSLFDFLTNWEYVDRLFANAQVTPDATFRNNLINGLNNGTETRATVLRKVVDYQAFADREYKPAFVLMQYFGYLRRNPSDPPDTNLDGYNFWLGQYNQHNDQHEAVKAFVHSLEYRGRFGKP